MKKTAVCIVLLCLTVFYSGCNRSDYREVNQYTIEQFMNTKSIFGGSFSHDEKNILYTSDESGIYNAYMVSVDGGEPVQLTHSTDRSVRAVSFFPDDNRILYMSDNEGNELYHVYVRDENGNVMDITPHKSARAIFYTWSHDEKSFFIGYNKRNPSFMDIYEVDIESLKPKLLFRNDGGYDFGAVSNDKQYIAFSKEITNHNSDIYLYQVKKGKMKHITPHEGDINYRPVTFSLESKSLYYLTDENSEFTYLIKYDIASGETVTVESADWDIMYTYFSRNGKYRVIGINEDAQTTVHILDTEKNKPVSLPGIPDANITSVHISKSEKLMAFSISSSRSPSDLCVFNFDTGQYLKLTDSMNPEIDTNDLVTAKNIRYSSFDGLEIPALLYKPHHIKPGTKAPALVNVHGGPGGQARIGYRSTIQYLVNHGYVVLDVNNRGSSGYGKTFYKLDDLKHGQDDLADCVEAKKFLASTGYVDENRIGIIGGSYGGYMVLAALTFKPDAFAIGIDLFGISNWVRTLKSIPPWWESFREALYKELGNPETDEEYLLSISPLFHAENIKKPLMVLQGANDPRVLKVESDEIVAAVHKNNVPVEYVLFEDEGHGFAKKENRIEGYEAILKFADQYLKEGLSTE